MSMMRDAEETTVLKGGEQPTARLGIPPERTSPLLEDSDAADRALTGETIVEYIDPLGTPAYMAPEQFRGRVSQHSNQ